MITKKKSTQAGYVTVQFELPAYLWAAHIFVVGEFNDWQRDSLPMTQDRNGVWRLALDLPAGRSYEFRYLVDDRWLTDGHADGVVTNTYGTQNSIVQTELPRTVIEDSPNTVSQKTFRGIFVRQTNK